ncbi:MAG: acyltransferase family protein [Actinomycetota bacterium]|nr:acyltransferase family protein [Actinomycetota bacterium]
MPEPVGQSRQRYMPGLDGLRAIAVLAVIAYHLDFGWASGGLLGVGVFFTLSGYLITDILLERWAGRRLSLTEFWLARARRLLPALFVLLIVVLAWVTIGDPAQLDRLRGETLASAFFISNWWFIFQDVSYFEQFGPPSPLGHIWSLGVEEQFYIVWPWLLLLGLRFFPARRAGLPGEEADGAGVRSGRADGRSERSERSRIQPRLAGVTLGLALVSIALMAILFAPGDDSTRAYEGTDTRAFGLLIGAALAMVWPSQRLIGKVRSQARRTLDLIGVAGLFLIALLVATTDEFSPFIYRGGLVILSIATAMVVASVAHPSSRIGRALGVAPLRWIGVRSYGIYLWQLPIITLTTPALAEFSWPRAVLQVVATFLIAALSWKFIEDPVRHGVIGRTWKRLRASHWKPEVPRLSPVGWAGAGAVGLVTLVGILGLVGMTLSSPVLPVAVTRAEPLKGIGNEKVAVSVKAEPDSSDPTRTSCRSVAYIGDSTSLGLVSSEYLPNPKQRIDARLTSVGAREQTLDIAGARSIVETIPGTTNAEDAATYIRDSGFRGCWIFALGTNEAANIFDGSTYLEDDRIQTMMDVTAGEPTLWINAKTLVQDGSGYDNARVKKWNEALLAACPSYPEMRVYDWVRDVEDRWYIDDGIHFTTPGYAQRSHLIAEALVEAFPAGEKSDAPEEGEPSSCLIRPPPEATRSPRESLEALGTW